MPRRQEPSSREELQEAHCARSAGRVAAIAVGLDKERQAEAAAACQRASDAQVARERRLALNASLRQRLAVLQRDATVRQSQLADGQAVLSLNRKRDSEERLTGMREGAQIS